jgi:toxin-antitoxin system PIN domain toxin
VILPDVNVLVFAHHAGAVEHAAYKSCWESIVNGDAAFGMADIVLSGFIRIVTHPKVFDTPMLVTEAVAAAEAIRTRPNCSNISPSERHWAIFAELCRRTAAKGNHVADASLAALAIDSGSDFLTADRGFARYPGLRWRHPLDVPT